LTLRAFRPCISETWLISCSDSSVVSYDGKLDVPGRMLVADNFGISKRLAHHHGMWVVSFVVTKRSALVVLLAVLTHIYMTWSPLAWSLL